MITIEALASAIKSVPRCDYLVIDVQGEPRHFRADKVRAACAALRARKTRKVTLIEACTKGLDFFWPGGGLRLHADAGRYVARQENGRTHYELMPFPGYAERPARLPASGGA